ncbi:MAG: nucleotide-binding universal stress UspA family protein [Parvicellaceae bacterium]|jgi:nucleotide-binding universal stress UspA family protein
MKRIVFPFEVCMDNRNAFVYASKLAYVLNTELILLNTFESHSEKEDRQRWNELQEEILGLQGYYQNEYSNSEDNIGIKHSLRCSQNQLLNEIFNTISKEPVELIVLNMPYYQTETKEITGEVMQEILEYTSVPVLMVPENKNYQPINKIVFATDFNTIIKDETNLNNALHLAKLFSAKIHFLHVVNAEKPEYEDKGMLERIAKLVKESDKFSYSKEKGTDLLQTVTKYVRGREIDLVVLVKQKRDIFESLFHDEFTRQLTLYSKVPIYILKESQRFSIDQIKQTTLFN